jgi:hypothetical protein
MTDVFPRASSSPLPVGERSRLLARVRAPLNSLIPLTRLTSFADLSPTGRGEDSKDL